MAEEDKGNEGEGQTKPEDLKRGRSRSIIIVSVIVAVQIAATLSGFYFFNQSLDPNEELSQEAATEVEDSLEQEIVIEEELEDGEELLGAMYPLGLFTVNLMDQGYVRSEIQIEFVERKIPRRLYSRIPIIRDGIIRILAQKKFEDLKTDSQKGVLKRDIIELINTVLRLEEVKDIWFTQFVLTVK